MAGALDGITVLDLTRGAAGAFATMHLSDHGARVIRLIDPDAPDFRDGGFIVWDRGKEVVRLAIPVTAAIGSPDAFLVSLLDGTDVVVEDFTPAERPEGVTFAALSARRPRIVTCSISGYGLSGRHRDEPAIDDLVMAQSGLLAGLPGFRKAPVHLVHPLPSAGAALLAALGIAAALYDREETGRGRAVETSLLAGALLYQPKVEAERLTPNAFQTNPYGSAPFYSVYACADDQWVQLGCVHPGFIAKAAALMGIADLLADPVYGRGQLPQTPEADAHLRKVLTGVLKAKPYDTWAHLFETNDIPFAKARLTEEGFDDPQVRHNEMVATLDDPAVGEVDQMGVPVKLRGTPGTVRGPRRAPVTPSDVRAPAAVTTTASKSAAQQRLPLAGLRVLEITNLIAGPIAGRLLADLGADVMKLEPPAGDISRPIGRSYFFSVNFGKRSVCVDTSTPEGKAIVRAIAATSDVVLANLRPGATERMGIGVGTDQNVVETQISGYGFTGPYATRPGIDPLAQALMGLERAQGGEGNPPSFPAQLAPTDFTTGTAAAFGTVMALFAKRRGASGQRVEANLLDGGIMLSSEWFTRYEGRHPRPLADRQQYGTGPCHRLYETADGFIYVAGERCGLDELAAAAGIALPSNDPSSINRHPNDTAAAAALADAFAGLTQAEALERLAARRIPAAPVLTPDARSFFSDPHVSANNLSVTRRHAELGDMTAVWRYVSFPGAEAVNAPATPVLGADTRDILHEAGLDRDAIVSAEAAGHVVSRSQRG